MHLKYLLLIFLKTYSREKYLITKFCQKDKTNNELISTDNGNLFFNTMSRLDISSIYKTALEQNDYK